MNPLNTATLLWDYRSEAFPRLPAQLLPENPEITDPVVERQWALQLIADKGQKVGTALDQLCEIAGRSCYDSFGKGRTAPLYHAHLIEVNHGSVWEHANFTAQFTFPPAHREAVWIHLLNRPGIHVEPTEVGARITANLRAIREWDVFTGAPVPSYSKEVLIDLRDTLKHFGNTMAPQVCPAVEFEQRSTMVNGVLVEPESAEEKWVTMFLTGSRGFTHELVRHKYRTAVSQRSTRYVDEDESQWVDHPLGCAYIEVEKVERAPNGEPCSLTLRQRIAHVKDTAKRTYKRTVEVLEPWLMAKGVDKFTARKQARGAARGYLGNALYTEAVFSASVAQWRRMLMQRANPAADAEIRDVFCQALEGLKCSRYAADFADLALEASPDGLGRVLAVRKNP